MLLEAVFAAKDAALGAEAGAILSTGAKKAARLAYTARAIAEIGRETRLHFRSQLVSTEHIYTSAKLEWEDADPPQTSLRGRFVRNEAGHPSSRGSNQILLFALYC